MATTIIITIKVRNHESPDWVTVLSHDAKHYTLVFVNKMIPNVDETERIKTFYWIPKFEKQLYLP